MSSNNVVIDDQNIHAVQEFVSVVIREIFPSIGLTPLGAITASWSLHTTVMFNILAGLHELPDAGDRAAALAAFRESVQDSIDKLHAITGAQSLPELEATMRMMAQSVSPDRNKGWQETGSNKVRG
ncbi:MAG: hypothetical protein ACYC2H_01390 [Thermoplasmatota archaeon]